MQTDATLIQELDELFRQDPDIDELGVIFSVPPPSETPDGTTSDSSHQEDPPSSPPFILREHKLGISVHSVHPLINEARRAFPEARSDFLRAQAGRKSGELADTERDRGGDLEAAAKRLLSVTRALLLVNADHGSAWNARKRIVLDGAHGYVREEIKLLDLIFTKHAKSPNAWAHRRWCWRNDQTFTRQQPARPWRPLEVEEELKVCHRVADLYPKNYYAWTQRSWVVLRSIGRATNNGVADGQDRASTMESAKELLLLEIAFVDKWLTSHVSDHSALNHRKNIISALGPVSAASGGAGVAFVEKERSSNSVLIRDYPGHGSLWCYRRFICQAFLIVTPPRALIDNSLQAGVPDNQAATLGIDRDAGAGDPYDWPGWNRATTQWYEGCVRADAMAQDTSSDEDSEGYTSSCEGARGEVLDYEKAEGALPGAPAGGGALAEFLGQEARFALKCATDKDAWQFNQQRRHALAHLAFVSYAADRILRRKENARASATDGPTSFGTGTTTTPGDQGSLGGCMTYCEVTGALKLTFPLGCDRGRSADERECIDRVEEADTIGCAVAGARCCLRSVNDFVAGLAVSDALETDGRKCEGGGVAPYRIENASAR